MSKDVCLVVASSGAAPSAQSSDVDTATNSNGGATVSLVRPGWLAAAAAAAGGGFVLDPLLAMKLVAARDAGGLSNVAVPLSMVATSSSDVAISTVASTSSSSSSSSSAVSVVDTQTT